MDKSFGKTLLLVVNVLFH